MSRRDSPRLALKTLEQEPEKLPDLRLDHLRLLSDSTGMFQHAIYSMPNFAEGYCTDDNARALLLTIMLEATGDDTPEVRDLAATYAAFLNYAFVPANGRFRNFMSFDRRWLEETGSDDSLGHALLALGACIGRSKDEDFRHWGVELFHRALPSIEEVTSPRAWALALAAIHDYFRRFSGDRVVNRLRDVLTQRLLDVFQASSSPDWVWFEDILAYANARLPHALILSGRWSNRADAFDVGLRSLRWLIEVQRSESGHFRPIGSNEFYRRGGDRAEFDQQPIEAYVTIAACIEAWGATHDDFWMREAWRAFEWFLGRNDLNQPLYDPKSGGCFDGLHVDRVNRNQGAESTLAFLLSLQEMRRVESTLNAFSGPERAAVGVKGKPAQRKSRARAVSVPPTETESVQV
jgi:hypothetical protein